MHWSIYSAVMFFSSVVYYLFVRQVQKLGINRQTYMFANFLLPALIYLILNILQGKSLIPNAPVLLVAVVNGILFNYVGSVLGYIGIEKAPNTGYSVIIQKSYAVYTSIAAVFLFGAQLPLTKYFYILLVIIFTAFLMIDPHKSKKGTKSLVGPWALYSLAAFFLFGNTSLAAKAASLLGAEPTVYLLWVMLVTLSLSTIDFIRLKTNLKFQFSRKQIMTILCMGGFVSIFYLSKNLSDIYAPNVGYSSAVNASSNALLVVASAFLYKEHLSLKKFLAALGTVLSIILLVYT